MFWASHQVCEALVPVAFGLVIDKAVRTGDGSAMIISVLGILGLFTVLTMSWRTGMWFLSQAVLEESHTLRLGVVRRLLSDPGSPGDRQTGEQLSIATSDSQAAAEVLEVIGWLAAALVGVAASAVFLLRIDWILGIGILIGVPLLVLGLSALGPLVQRRTASQQQAVGLAAGTAADLLRGLRPLRGFGGVPAAIGRYQQCEPGVAAGRDRGGPRLGDLHRGDDLQRRGPAGGGGRSGRGVRDPGPDQHR